MITIYHLFNSRSERIFWLMEELGEPYEHRDYKREPSMSAPADYRALHPMGLSPAIRDGDLVLVESGAIVEYILEKYGKGRFVPKLGTPERPLYLQWMHFSEGTAIASILNEGMFSEGAGTNRFSTIWRERNERMLNYLNDELGRRPYFAGRDFTGADIMMGYPFGTYERFLRRPLTPYPNIQAYLTRIRARPAYQRAQAIAMPAK